MRTLFLAFVLATFAPLAGSQGIYKCTGPSGRVMYTDEPSDCTGNVVRVEPPSQPSAAPEPAPVRKGEQEFVRQADQRAADLAKAYDDIVAAYNKLRAAQESRDAGVEPLEGERQGRRYRPEYWERQGALRRDVEEAQHQLDEALARRNALR